MENVEKKIDEYVDSITPTLNQYAIELAKLWKSFVLQLWFGSVEFNFERKPNKEESEPARIDVNVQWFDIVKKMTKIIWNAREYAQKFINKVEDGRARSKETYADMKNLAKEIDELLLSKK